jgi:TRAP-type mannitol/chloroaromatic compound transport system permease small subunit
VLLVDEHVRVDVLSSRWPPRVRALVDALVLALVALPMTGLFVVFGWDLFVHALLRREASFNAGGLIVWPLYGAMVLGMALLGLQALSELIRRIAFLRGGVGRATLGEADLPPIVRAPGTASGERGR